MNSKNDKQRQTLGVPRATPTPIAKSDIKNAKEIAEQKEVAGRHKNDGQMGHKGAR
jgi:hypothetical protein